LFRLATVGHVGIVVLSPLKFGISFGMPQAGSARVGEEVLIVQYECLDGWDFPFGLGHQDEICSI